MGTPRERPPPLSPRSCAPRYENASIERRLHVNALGLGLFLAFLPLGVAGLCDPRPVRGTITLTAAALAVPIGLLTAAL